MLVYTLQNIKYSIGNSATSLPWQCQSQAWIKEEGDANDLCYDTASLNSKSTNRPNGYHEQNM